MIGKSVKFICGQCEQEQTHTLGLTQLFEINKVKNVVYHGLRCCKCNKLQYVSNEDVVLEQDVKSIKHMGTMAY